MAREKKSGGRSERVYKGLEERENDLRKDGVRAGLKPRREDTGGMCVADGKCRVSPEPGSGGGERMY